MGDERPWLDDIPDAFAEVDGKAEETELHDALHLLLSTLAPEELSICKAIMADLSERASAVSPQFFAWLFGFGTEVQILSPESVREAYKSELTALAGLYNIAVDKL